MHQECSGPPHHTDSLEQQAPPFQHHEEQPPESAHDKTSDEYPTLLPKEFLDVLQRLGTPEEKLDHTITFMQEILEGGGPHQFRAFWDARRRCLEFFQTPIHPTARVRLWTRYSELCREARRLKELFEEQSAFVTEQVEMAIDAVAEEFIGLEERLGAVPEIEALKACPTLVCHADQYQALQHELNYLNSFATRITALRKEVVKTELRYKQKARLLERLRVLGDWVYPRRKRAIHDVSELFLADVAAFIQATFVGELKTHELCAAREEIKALQGIGKLLTLSTEAFTKTRLQLSECWDSIKIVLKERKKAQSERRQILHHHRDEILGEIEALKASAERGTMKGEDMRKEIRKIDARMHAVTLSHQDVLSLRERLRELDSLAEQQRSSEKRVSRQEHDQKTKLGELCSRAQSIMSGNESLPAMEAAFFELRQDPLVTSLSKSDRLTFDYLCSAVRDKIERRRKECLPVVSGEEDIAAELVALDQMRSDIKEQLEVWRKARGSSGADFSEGLRYQELIEEERARLERVEAMVEELEGRLASSSTTESCP